MSLYVSVVDLFHKIFTSSTILFWIFTFEIWKFWMNFYSFGLALIIDGDLYPSSFLLTFWEPPTHSYWPEYLRPAQLLWGCRTHSAHYLPPEISLVIIHSPQFAKWSRLIWLAIKHLKSWLNSHLSLSSSSWGCTSFSVAVTVITINSK